MNERLDGEHWKENRGGGSPETDFTLRLSPAECPEVGAPLCSGAGSSSCPPASGCGDRGSAGTGRKETGARRKESVLDSGRTRRTLSPTLSKTSGVEMTRREAEAGDRRRRTGVTGCLGFKWRPSSLGNEQERGGGRKRGERGDSLSSFCAGHSGLAWSGAISPTSHFAPISQMRKLRRCSAERPAQGHRAGQGRTRTATPGPPSELPLILPRVRRGERVRFAFSLRRKFPLSASGLA